MSSEITFFPDDQAKLLKRHEIFKKKVWQTGLSTLAAAFLTIGALIVIYSSCLCLTLPGINVISHVILPGILPGAGGLLLSISFTILSVRKAREKNEARKKQINWHLRFLRCYQVHRMEKKDGASFIVKNFLNLDGHWTKEYSSKILGDIKKKYPKEEKDQNTDQKALLKILDAAKKELYAKK